MKKDNKLWIDCCAGSELKDTQGETLNIEGADISDLQSGRGRWNDNHGKGFYNSLGMITEAKKIFKAEDCENDRHKYYWEKIKAPYIYAKGYLYNNEDHPNARAAAAILRNIHKEDTPLKLKSSVEGGVLSRGVSDPTRLAHTKIHSVALTFTPANNATLVEPINLDKSNADWEKDKQLIKSVMHLAETNVPSFRHIERHASANTIHENINKIQELAKSLGIEIEVKDSNPEIIMKNAVMNKIANNINKINNLVKAIGPNGLAIKPKPIGGTAKRQAADAARMGNGVGMDRFQQNVGQLKSNPAVPKLPQQPTISDTMRTKPAQQVMADNTFKAHAMKAMSNPGHLETVQNSLMNSGVSPEKIQIIMNKINSHMNKSLPEDFKDKLKKALTAGYGGAGAPTNLTGGGVIQSESLDHKKSDSNKGFQYVVCDNCGHEQIVMKHQVKCRNCKQNFPFSKLNDIM